MQLFLMDASQRNWQTFPEELVKLPGTGEKHAYRFIKRKEVIPLISNAFHTSAWNQWCRWKRFGLPHGSNGWMHERMIWIQCIELIDQEYTLYQRFVMQQGRKQHGIS